MKHYSAKAAIGNFRVFPNVKACQVDRSIMLRPAVDADFPVLARLFHDAACSFITPGMAPEVAATFLRENDEGALRKYRDQGHQFQVATIAGAVAGYSAVRPPSHLFHLFVAGQWHRKGVARALWNAARAAMQQGAPFTVNASPYAVPAYAALGFRCDGAPQERNGVHFQPMVWCA